MRTTTVPNIYSTKRTCVKAEKVSIEISCKNIIAGIMVGTSLLASAVIAYACM